jgi:transcription antitermination factor NusG
VKTNWYVLYTRSHCEKKVAAQLAKKEIEHYCPLNRVVRKWADRKKVLHEPLFTSYVFVRSTEQLLYQVKQVSNDIVNFVYWLGKPAIIRENEIENIKLFLSEHTDVKLEKCNVSVGDPVRILSGPFMNKDGNVVSLERKNIKLVLPSLGYFMTAEVKLSNVELINFHCSTEKLVSLTS